MNATDVPDAPEEASSIILPRSTLRLIRLLRTHHRLTILETFKRFCEPALREEWKRVAAEVSASIDTGEPGA